MVNKIMAYFNARSRKRRIKQYVDNGNLALGSNTDISRCNIYLPAGMPKGKLAVTIGNDCLIEGNIVLYRPEAEVHIGHRVFIGHSTCFYSYGKITVGSDILFSWGITVMDTNAHSLVWEERKNDVSDWKRGSQYKDWSNVKHGDIVFKDKCWIGFNSIVLKGVTVGEGSVVGAGSVVARTVADYTAVAGNPAVAVKTTN